MRGRGPAPVPPFKNSGLQVAGLPPSISQFCIVMRNFCSHLGADFCTQLWLGLGNRGKAFLAEMVGKDERSSVPAASVGYRTVEHEMALGALPCAGEEPHKLGCTAWEEVLHLLGK